MKRLGAIKSVRRVASTAVNSPNKDFLREVIGLIKNQVDVAEDESEENEDGDGANANSQNEQRKETAASGSSSTPLTDVQR